MRGMRGQRGMRGTDRGEGERDRKRGHRRERGR